MKKILTTTINKAKPSPAQALEGLKMFFDAVKENHRVTEEETTKRHHISAMKEVEIERIRMQKEILKEYFETAFKEREKNFDKLFETLDEGIKSNNLQLIQISLGAIIEIAKDSPLKDIKKTLNDFHNPDVNEIEI